MATHHPIARVWPIALWGVLLGAAVTLALRDADGATRVGSVPLVVLAVVLYIAVTNRLAATRAVPFALELATHLVAVLAGAGAVVLLRG